MIENKKESSLFLSPYSLFSSSSFIPGFLSRFRLVDGFGERGQKPPN
jgi:hypothetical protein